MYDECEKLRNYPSFSMTNGMILQELMQEKRISFDEVFSILGPKNLVLEIINDKKVLKPSQIQMLARLFNISPDVFNSNIESEFLNDDPIHAPEAENLNTPNNDDNDNYEMKSSWED